MRNYGIKFVIPSLYVINAKILRCHDAYMLQAAKYVMPKEGLLPEVITHKARSSESTYESYADIYRKYIDNVVIRLLHRQCCGSIHKEDSEFILEGADYALLEVSDKDENNYLAIFYTKNSKDDDSSQHILVYKIDDQANPEALFKKMNDEEYTCSYSTKDPRNKQKEIDLSFVRHLMFDNEMNFLIGYGKTSFFMLDLAEHQSDRLKVHNINEQEFEKIHHM